MFTRRTVLPAIAVAATLVAPAVIAQPAPSQAFQQAIVDGLSPETRAEVQRRATGGNSVYEVARVILLNNMQLANLIKPGEPPQSEVVAIDFIRQNAVFRQGDNLRVIPFDARTLTFKQ
jgi:hypothetical protein